MSCITWLRTFLQGLNNDQTLRTRLGPAESMLEQAIQELDILETEIVDRDYELYALKPKHYGEFYVNDNREIVWTIPVGTRISYVKNNLISNPKCIKYDPLTELIYIACYDWQVRVYDRDFTFRGGFSKDLQYAWGIDVDDEIVVTSLYARHQVVCCDKKTGEQLWQYGDGVAGSLQENRCYNPTGVAILPNGNILVANYYGKENPEDSARGTLSEHDRNTGNLVKVLAKFNTTGNPWNNEVINPTYLQVVANPQGETEIWLSLGGRDYLAVFKYNPGQPLEYKQVFGRSDYLSLVSLTIRGFRVNPDYTRIYVACSGPQVVAVVDMDTANVIGYIGQHGYEASKYTGDTPGVFLDLTDVELIENELLVADIGNQRIQGFPAQLVETPSYLLEFEKVAGGNLSQVEYISDEKFSRQTLIREVATRDILAGLFPKKVVAVGKR